MSNLDRIEEYVRAHVGAYAAIDKLAGDASTREYYRIHSGNGTRILCSDSAFVGIPVESYPYYIVYRLFLEQGIPVPRVYDFDGGSGLLLIEDMGDTLVESHLKGISSDEIKQLYSRLIDILISIQSIEKNPDLIPFRLSFDPEKLMFEFDFFIGHSLCGYFGVPTDASEINTLRREFRAIAEILYEPGMFVLTHRDYHSRNIMITGGDPFIIDFQDARMGLPQYDLVSLLRDSYVRLDNEMFAYLKEYYFRRSIEAGIHRMSRDEFDYYFDIMAFQRNVKALGTFGYQVRVLGKAYFEKYIATTAGYLDDYVGRRDELKLCGALLAGFLGEGR